MRIVKNKKVLIVTLIIFISAISAMGFTSYFYAKHIKTKRSEERQAAITDMQEQLSLLSQSVTDVEPVPVINNSTTELDILGQLTQEILADQIALRNGYLAELNSIEWFSILDPNRIALDKSLVEANITIEKAKTISQKYKQKHFKALEDIKAKVEQLDIQESKKRDWLAGYDKSMRSSQAIRDKIWVLEASILDEVEDIINLLASNPDSWTVDGDEILFESDSILLQYNNHIESISSLSTQQQEIQLGTIQKANDSLESLK